MGAESIEYHDQLLLESWNAEDTKETVQADTGDVAVRYDDSCW